MAYSTRAMRDSTFCQGTAGSRRGGQARRCEQAGAPLPVHPGMRRARAQRAQRARTPRMRSSRARGRAARPAPRPPHLHRGARVRRVLQPLKGVEPHAHLVQRHAQAPHVGLRRSGGGPGRAGGSASAQQPSAASLACWRCARRRAPVSGLLARAPGQPAGQPSPSPAPPPPTWCPCFMVLLSTSGAVYGRLPSALFGSLLICSLLLRRSGREQARAGMS